MALAPHRATREAINLLHGQIVPNSGARVDATVLDENGVMLFPEPPQSSLRDPSPDA